MLDRLRSGKAFEALHRDTWRVALREVETKFTDKLGGDPAIKKAQQKLALPFKHALERGLEPTLAGKYRVGADQDLYALRLGDTIFPITAQNDRWGRSELTLWEPIPAHKFKDPAILHRGLSGFYDGPKNEAQSIKLLRRDGPTTDLSVNGQEVIKDQSWAWALWETVGAAVRRAEATRPKAVPKVFDPVLEREVERPVARDAESRLIDAAIVGAQRDLPASAGPPMAHDLLGAFSVRGRPVVVTSLRGSDEPVKVWLQDKPGAPWMELPLPPRGAPVRGATVLVKDDQLHLMGGLDAQGKVLDRHFTLDLSRANPRTHRPEDWQELARLADPVAFASAISDRRETFVAGGVAGFYAKQGEKAKAPAYVRKLTASAGNDWRTRAAPPNDMVRGATLAREGCLFIGPGNDCSSKLYAYDNQAGGVWHVLPQLPGQLGLGQLLMRDGKLIYAGGFEANGRPSSAIYQLDLDSLEPTWKKLGDSPYVAGFSKLLEANGKLMSVMVTPAASRVFHLDLGA